MPLDDPIDRGLYVHGERVRLRPLRIEDAAVFQPWINDPEVQRLAGGRGGQFSLPAQEDYVRARLVNDWEHGFALAIEATDLGDAPTLIGNLELRKLEAVERRGDIGIMIGDREFWSRGYGEDAMRTICRYGFRDLDLHRLELNVAAFNARALRCYEKVGFTIEGRLRDHRFVSGRYYDTLLMGLLREDFEALEPVND
jgi:RimJ/RimL family protein N-acetyltransferase